MKRTARPAAEMACRSGSPLPDKIVAASTGIATSASPRLLFAPLAPCGRGAGGEGAFPCSTLPCSPLSPAKGRRAFTLVELLMVIVIIGILVALVTLAASRAITAGKQTAVLTEISQLSMALDSYKQKHGSYPPNPGTEETATQRGQRFERHWRRAFPRFIAKANLKPDTSKSDILDIAEQIRLETIFTGPNVPAAYSAPLKSGDLAGLDLDDLDGAEALVFFLGGMPNPTASNKLTGFAADPSNPFQSSVTQPQRSQRFFEFDPTRLVDRDGDGWYEYVPNLKTSVVDTAPYAYFDSGSYGLGSHYPYNHSNTATQERLAGLWGYAVPYGAQYVVPPSADGGDPADPRTWAITGWQEPDKFQIICVGIDGQYGGRPDPLTIQPESGGIWQRVFPTGEGYKKAAGTAALAYPGYLDLDSDNMTNFAEKPIGEVEAPTSP